MDRNSLSNIVFNETVQMAINPLHIPPLFHGTNRKALSYSKEEREKISVACEIIMRYLLKAYNEQDHPKYEEQKAILGDFVNDRFKDAYVVASGRMDNLSFYQYHDIYVSLNPRVACMYARRAEVLGETGYTTYWLHEGIKRLGLKLPKQTSEEKEAFKLFYKYKDVEDYDPVVLMFCGLQREDLQIENGDSLTDNQLELNLSLFDGKYRVVKPNFDLLKGEYLSVVEAFSIEKYVRENKEEVLENLRNDILDFESREKEMVLGYYNSRLDEVINLDQEIAEQPKWSKMNN